jgi:dipeptidyl aminopeptidase/acylaminoacyl peptidase
VEIRVKCAHGMGCKELVRRRWNGGTSRAVTQRLTAVALVLGLTLALSTSHAQEPPASMPEGVSFRELERGRQLLWLYTPVDQSPSALVVVPPAGGTLLTAPGLAPGDRPEHTPYVEAGFAVVSFLPSGALRGTVTRSAVRGAILEFADARAGVIDAKRAIDAALTEVPELAGRPIFAAGHSSAANLALALAAEDARIRAVIAYAPAADAVAHVEGGWIVQMAEDVPGALELLAELSPVALADRLTAPVMLFHAEDDDVTPIAGTRRLAALLEEHGRPPHLLTVPGGGHYDAMIAEGIPAGVDWLTEQLARVAR